MLEIKILESLKHSDILIIPIFEEKKFVAPRLPAEYGFLKTVFEFVSEHESFRGKEKESLTFRTTEKNFPRVLLIGVGKEGECYEENFRVMGGIAGKVCRQMKVTNASLLAINKKADSLAEYFVEGFMLGGYKFTKYKAKKDDKKTKEMKVLNIISKSAGKKEYKELIERKNHVIEGVNLARDLVNMPSNDMHPENVEKQAKELAKMSKQIKVSVIDAKKLKSMGAGAILAVGQGSKHAPRFVILEYKAKAKKAKTIGLVGKGITFDTGGINLKPTGHIETMKMDMAGSAAVLGVFRILAKCEAKVNVIGVLAIAENSIGSLSYRPGDIVMSLSGKSIEITNTDAEGRLVLADALSYIQDKYKNLDAIIDIATLTGACIAALGYDITALIGNAKTVINKLKDAARTSGEKVWMLPLDSDLKETVKGDISDLKNYTKGVGAGATMGGCFLNAFINDNTRWAHLDIAGTGWAEKAGPYKSKGGTGTPVRLLWEFVKEYE